MKVDRPGGLGAWDEFSPVAQTIRELLLLAAGVRVPGAGFVLGCLALYLLVLVPLNWLVFHTIERGRMGLASGPRDCPAGDVGRGATGPVGHRLRAGRDRNRRAGTTGPSPPGVLTRFTACYSSLATTYDITFPDNATALALPFPANSTDRSEWQHTVRLERNVGTELRDLAVSSASTHLVHSEEIAKLDGPLRLGESSRASGSWKTVSQYSLRDVAVVRRFFDKANRPRYDGTWIGDLSAGQSVLLALLPVDPPEERLPFEAERRPPRRYVVTRCWMSRRW